VLEGRGPKPGKGRGERRKNFPSLFSFSFQASICQWGEEKDRVSSTPLSAAERFRKNGEGKKERPS